MKCFRIFPDTIPRISAFELSSLSLNIALGNAVTTVASTSIGSDFATQFVSVIPSPTPDRPAILRHNHQRDKHTPSLSDRIKPHIRPKLPSPSVDVHHV